jgi:hypothetical protein
MTSLEPSAFGRVEAREGGAAGPERSEGDAAADGRLPQGLQRLPRSAQVPRQVLIRTAVALAGLSLSDYLIQEVRRVAERPTVAELKKSRERSRFQAGFSDFTLIKSTGCAE